MESAETSDLSSLERKVQEIICDVTNFIGKSFKFAEGKKYELTFIETQLRRQMRILRRWRNGSKHCTLDEILEFSQHLAWLRVEILSRKMAVIAHTLENLNTTSARDDDVAENLTSQRLNLESEMSSLKVNVQSLTIENEDILLRCEMDVSAVVNSLVQLLQLVYEEKKRYRARNHSTSSRNPPSRPITRIEDHLEVNRVLKNATKARFLMDVLREGGHMTSDETCVGNDLEVLRRQLRKIQEWQQCSQAFVTADVDDLELILSAIERHISPDIIFDKSILKARRKMSTSTVSETSDEFSYTNPPAVTSEAPPPYDVSYLSSLDVTDTDTMSDRDHNHNHSDYYLDERLI